jgi:3alpha(or 20beta)-hydroxysteroid dehydrogenase
VTRFAFLAGRTGRLIATSRRQRLRSANSNFAPRVLPPWKYGRRVRLQGKVAVITGGARGQGAAEARLFAQEGARVLVTDVLDDLGEATAKELGDAGRYQHLDVTDPDGWTIAVDAALAAFNRIDILVNNAGIGFPPLPFDEAPLEAHHQVVDVNLHGVHLGMRAVASVMKKQRAGSIVNISSIDGIVGVAGMVSYSASKFAVTGMTRSAALELGRFGVRVNSIHPGVIDSPMVQAAPPEVRASLDRLFERQAISRAGTPEEIAYLALYLASDESSYCTGAQFVIDGGHLAGPYREGWT